MFSKARRIHQAKMAFGVGLCLAALGLPRASLADDSEALAIPDAGGVADLGDETAAVGPPNAFGPALLHPRFAPPPLATGTPPAGSTGAALPSAPSLPASFRGAVAGSRLGAHISGNRLDIQ
ncbi:MAG TPA: hypothetical protein ENK26_15325 [Gammaproteobacteria bacterium]|nr:hypothetical protein [Gammaproteobacteria bacterium]